MTIDKLPFEIIEEIISQAVGYRRGTFTPAIHERQSAVLNLLSMCSSWRCVAMSIFYSHAFVCFKQYQPPKQHAMPFYQASSISTNLDVIMGNGLGGLVRALHMRNLQMDRQTPLECLLPCLALDEGNHRHMRRRGLVVRNGRIENIQRVYGIKYARLVRMAVLSLHRSLPNVNRLSVDSPSTGWGEAAIWGALVNAFAGQLNALDCNMTPNFPRVKRASIRRLVVGQRNKASGQERSWRTVDGFLEPRSVSSLCVHVGETPLDWGYFCRDAASGQRAFDGLQELALVDTFINNEVFELNARPAYTLTFASLTSLTLRGLLIKPSFADYFLHSPLTTLKYLDAIEPSISSLVRLAGKLHSLHVEVGRPFILTSRDDALRSVNELFGRASRAHEAVLDIRATRCLSLRGSWPHITRLSVMGKMDMSDFLDALFEMPNLTYVAISPCFSDEREVKRAGRALLGGKYKYANREQSKVDVLSLVQSKKVQTSLVEQRLLVRFYRWNMDEIVWFFPNFKVILADPSLCLFS
ncbi:hypothetical protein EV183_001038 [Coemansia sp. RSA 2336]|nr:hypothetical protein EV183_001038 [Coemansia sp. RSA 2336]